MKVLYVIFVGEEADWFEPLLCNAVVWFDPSEKVDITRGGSRGGNSAMAPFQFGYRLWPPSDEEINVSYWETY